MDSMSIPLSTLEDRTVIRKAAEKFNVNVRDGIDFLIESKVLPNDSPTQVAKVFHSVQGLSKRRIGEFLGKPDSYNQKVLSAWLSELRLTGLDIDEGIRQMVLQLRLPGEAQQIDRIIEKFASEYFKQNQGIGLNEDLVYVLAFSLIMLNTDLHNSRVAIKMTCDEFIRNNRGIDNGKDVSPIMLTRIFERLKNNPIRMNEDDMFESEVSTFVAPLRSGWMFKRGSGKLSTYKKYWFVLTDGCLYYFETRQDRDPRAIVPLESCRISASRSRSDLILLTRDDGQMLKSMKMANKGGMKLSQHRQLVFRMVQGQDRDEWVRSFQEAIRSQLAEVQNSSGSDGAAAVGMLSQESQERSLVFIAEDPPTGDSLVYECHTPDRSISTQDSQESFISLRLETVVGDGSGGDSESSPEPKFIMFRDDLLDNNKTREDGSSTMRRTGGGSMIHFPKLSDRRDLSTSRSRNYDSDSDVSAGESFDNTGGWPTLALKSPKTEKGPTVGEDEDEDDDDSGGIVSFNFDEEAASEDRDRYGIFSGEQHHAQAVLEAQRLQSRVSVSRARGHGDSDFILLKRISQIVAEKQQKEETCASDGNDSKKGKLSYKTIEGLLATCLHIRDALETCTAVPPISRRFTRLEDSNKEGGSTKLTLTSKSNSDSDAGGDGGGGGNEGDKGNKEVSFSTSAIATQASRRARRSVKGSVDVVKWAKSADVLLRKYDKQRSYNIEVLMKLQALERSVHVVCRICTDHTDDLVQQEKTFVNDASIAAPLNAAASSGDENTRSSFAMKTICEVYSDREVGLLEGDEKKWKSFSFDKVWGSEVDHKSVFQDVEVLLTSVVEGYCTCLIGVGDHLSGRRAVTVFGSLVEASDGSILDPGQYQELTALGLESGQMKDDKDFSVELGLAFHSACALFNSIQENESDETLGTTLLKEVHVYMGEVLSDGSLVDLLLNIEGGELEHENMNELRQEEYQLDDHTASVAPCIGSSDEQSMTKVVMKSCDHLVHIFKHALKRRNKRGNAVLCFDLTSSGGGRLLVVDQGLADGTSGACLSSPTASTRPTAAAAATYGDKDDVRQGTSKSEDKEDDQNVSLNLIISAMMTQLSASVMQLGNVGGDAESLRLLLGEKSVALSMYCVGSNEAAHAATGKYLLHSSNMQNKLSASNGQLVEGPLVQMHMRALKTRIASARQSAETLHADAEQLHRELGQLRLLKKNVAPVLIFEEDLSSAQAVMDTQLSLLVSGLDTMRDYVQKEASSRDQHIAKLVEIESDLKQLRDTSSTQTNESVDSNPSYALKIALNDHQTAVEVLLREMHLSIISKILIFQKEKSRRPTLRERKELSMATHVS